MGEFDYKPNSNKAKAERREAELAEKKEIKKVVSGQVQTKKNNARKISDKFFQGDLDLVKESIWKDILVPTIKKIIVDTVDTIVYPNGDSGRRNRSTVDRVSYRDYNKISSRDDRFSRGSEDSRPRSGFDYDDLVFTSRGDVEAVLNQMDDVINRYGYVTVADLYDMVDLTAPYTSNRFGWTSTKNARVGHGRGGFTLELPRAMAID